MKEGGQEASDDLSGGASSSRSSEPSSNLDGCGLLRAKWVPLRVAHQQTVRSVYTANTSCSADLKPRSLESVWRLHTLSICVRVHRVLIQSQYYWTQTYFLSLLVSVASKNRGFVLSSQVAFKTLWKEFIVNEEKTCKLDGGKSWELQ